MWSDVNVETGAVHVVPAFNEVLEESRRKRGNKGENNGSNGPTKGNKKTGPDRKTGVTEPNIRSPSKTRPTWRGQEGSLKLSRFRFFYPESLPSHHPNLRQTDPYAYCEARFLDLLELVFVHNVLVAFVSHHVGALHAVCRARTRVWLYTTFMPVGYPDSVGEEYLEFQIYDCIQGLCSYLRTVLCTKALLEGAGLGTVTSTSALAAALVWVSRDMCGMVANLLFASAYSQSFSSYVKEWRLFADIANDVGQTLDMLAPWTANGQTLWIPLHSIRFGVKYLVEATNFFLLSGLEWRAWDILVDYWIALLNSMQRDVFLPFYLYFLSPLGGVFPALLDNLPTGVADALRSLVDPELVYREGFTQDVLSDWHNVSTGKTSLSRSGSFAKPGFRLTTPPTTFWEQPVLYLFGTPCSCVIRVFYCMVGNLRLFLTSLHDYIPLWVNTEVSFYLILLSVSAICKAVCGVSAGAAKLCTTYHFSLGRMEDRDKALLDGDKDKALLDAGDKDKKASGGDKDKKASGGDQPDGEGTEEAKCSTTSGSSTSSSSSSSKNGDQIPRIPQADPGDLATKECTQETAVTFIGLLLGMLLAKLCGSESSSGQQGSAGGEETTFWNSFSLSWGLFLFLTAVHVWANYRAVRCLNLRFLNRTRTYLLVQSFLKEQQIKDHGNTSSGGQSLSVRSINRRETLYQWFRVNCYRRRPKIAEISCAEAQRAYLRSLRDCTEQRRLLQKDEHEKNFLDSVGINKADTTVLPAEMLLSSEILEKHQLASKDKESSRRTLVTDKDGRYAVGRIEGAWTAFLKQNCNDMDKLESYFEVCKKTLLLQNDKVAEEASFEKFLGSLRTQGWDLDPRSFRLQPGKWRLKLNA